jgi:hypothetical protein
MKKKNIYISAFKYELSRVDGIERICAAISPDAYISESIAWCWFEKHGDDLKAIKEMLKKIGY